MDIADAHRASQPARGLARGGRLVLESVVQLLGLRAQVEDAVKVGDRVGVKVGDRVGVGVRVRVRVGIRGTCAPR